MKTKLISISLLLVAIVFMIVSCTEKTSVTPSSVTLDVSSTNLSPTANLGRVLFYDNHLSVNNAISCGSCHKQSLAFADNASFSRGFENRLSLRNAPPIQNLNFSSKLFWDGRDSVLTHMVLKPVLNHVEMGMNDQSAVVQRIINAPYYSDLFNKAFGTSKITIDEIANALGDFVENISANNTRFDQFLRGRIKLSPLELQGRALFFDKYDCNSCHQTTAPNAYQFSVAGKFVNIGLDKEYTDNGLGAITHNAADNGKFKVPSLRNIALTAPYMHDGRFATLDQVLEHYSHGISANPNLDKRLKTSDGSPKQFNISGDDKIAIIAFLNTLTDMSMVTNSDLSNPFKIK